MKPLLKLPIGIQDFATIRTDGYLYVDKTQHLYNLITGGKVYFLSRPRRFGKSLLISTLETIFKTERHLFKDTWLDQSDYTWPKHPVVRIDMSELPTKETPQKFNIAMLNLLQRIAREHQVALPEITMGIGVCLKELILLLNEKYTKVVVLIDEYDKPILDNINDPAMAQTMRDILRQFYTILKAQDGNLRFVLLTGVTKFSRVSVFSGLNNLQDLTMTDKYATLCGYTQAELVNVFTPWIEQLALQHNRTVTDELAMIKHWYNGYQFSRRGERVYNPFSTLLLFEHQEYRPHWFATGTPKFLIDLIEQAKLAPEQIENLEVSDTDLESHDVMTMGLVALLYQTGYLTIQSYDDEARLYRLGYPNFEVKESFTRQLFERMSEAPLQEQMKLISDVFHSIRARDYAQMFEVLKTFFAVIPYQLHQPTEKYYHSLFYLIMHLVGYRVNAEVSTHRGRIDAVLVLKDRVLIFEFKLNQSADVALQQIHDKQYAQPYQQSGKPVLLFGVNFDTTARNIVEWKMEMIK